MMRDFSDSAKQKLLNLVSEVEDEKMSDFTDWMGDRWYDFESWIGTLNIKNYINNVNAYHKKVIDKNNATKESIEKIFSDVKKVDISYTPVFSNANTLLGKWENYMAAMSDMVSPGNGQFEASYIQNTLNDLYMQLKGDTVEAVRNSLKHEDGIGNVSYDTQALETYLKMQPEDMTDAEKEAVIQIINELSELNAFHTTVMSYGDENAEAYLAYISGYTADEETYMNFIACGAYYNDMYLKVLNIMSETSKDNASFSSKLLNIGNENVDVGILGMEGSAEIERFLKNIPVSASADLSKYRYKIETQYAELYAQKVTISGEAKASADVKIKGSKKKQKDDSIKVVYDPKTGGFRECGKDEFKELEEKARLAGIHAGVSAESSMVEGTLSGESEYASGSVTAKIGTAKVDANLDVGLYVYDSSGNKIIAPTVKAELGGSVSAISVSANGRVGNESIGVYGKGNVDLLEAEGKLDAKFTLLDKDGNFDLQAGVGASAEANLVEASGSAGVEVFGADVGVTGSVKVGVGAHANAGFVDGHLKLDVGVAVGVGASLGLDIDVGGLIDGVATTVANSWSDISSAASKMFAGIGSFFS